MKEAKVAWEIERFCSEVRTRGGVRTIIIFGSRVRGEHTENSDADICLIANGLPEEVLKRRYPGFAGYQFLSVFGFHPDEFLKMLEDANPFILDIVACGRLLYDDGFFKEIERSFQEVVKKYRLEREERGWSWRKS